jgi:hypothetical protein
MTERDDPVACLADERELVGIVDLRQVLGAREIHVRHGEKPQIEALGRQPPDEFEQPRGVLRADGAQVQGRPVLEDDVCLVALRREGTGLRRRGMQRPGGRGFGEIGFHQSSFSTGIIVERPRLRR